MVEGRYSVAARDHRTCRWCTDVRDPCSWTRDPPPASARKSAFFSHVAWIFALVDVRVNGSAGAAIDVTKITGCLKLAPQVPAIPRHAGQICHKQVCRQYFPCRNGGWSSSTRFTTVHAEQALTLYQRMLEACTCENPKVGVPAGLEKAMPFRIKVHCEGIHCRRIHAAINKTNAKRILTLQRVLHEDILQPGHSAPA